MSYFKGEKEFFPGIGQIQFEGRESKNPLAFHYYDADKVVMGKTLSPARSTRWTPLSSL